MLSFCTQWKLAGDEVLKIVRPRVCVVILCFKVNRQPPNKETIQDIE